MDAERYARCGGGRLIRGALVWNAPLRFKPDDAGGFSRGEETRAVACDDCGHVELRLAR